MLNDRAIAGPLGDFDPQQIREELHRMADWIADYRIGIAERPVFSEVEEKSISSALETVEWKQPVSMDTIMAELNLIVMPGIVHWGHPSFLGYFGSTSTTPSLLGEMAAAALNVSAMTWKSSPAATEMEGVVLEWIREMTGVPAGYTGVVYDTASVGVMHALAAARESPAGMCGLRDWSEGATSNRCESMRRIRRTARPKRRQSLLASARLTSLELQRMKTSGLIAEHCCLPSPPTFPTATCRWPSLRLLAPLRLRAWIRSRDRRNLRKA